MAEGRSQQDSHRGNAFDVMRVLAASGVLLGHSYAFFGLKQPEVLPGIGLGPACVFVFFALSGYLVGQSWQRDPHLGRFAIKRALRILPGLIVAVLLTALVLGPLVSELPPATYFSERQTWVYMSSNITMFGAASDLPGVFLSSRYTSTVNGSLWTLPYEVLMYAVLATCGLIACRLRSRAVFLLPLLAAIALSVCSLLRGDGPWSVQLPVLWLLHFDWRNLAELACYFYMGCALQLFEKRLPLRIDVALVGALLLAMSVPLGLPARCVAWFVVPYVLLVLAWRSPAWLHGSGKRDYSYGIYIYAFPIQQWLTGLAIQHGWAWGICVLASAGLTLCAAALSWHFVERPALQLKNRVMAPRFA